MGNRQIVMYEEELNQLQNVVDRLVESADAKVVVIVSEDAQLIVASGDVDNCDLDSLASLIAGHVATNELATELYKRKKANVHIQRVHERVILGVLFDGQSSSELVRLRAQEAGEEVLDIISERRRGKVSGPKITDQDIEDLFKD
jgi:predicted regulator of Ras-like GTPase activity (Roadblock/LC7/MglB family)